MFFKAQIFAALTLVFAGLSQASDSPFCGNDHGGHTCVCDFGYTGPNCNNVTNFCHEPFPVRGKEVTFGSVCSEHGTCKTKPGEGATCICKYGWEGPLCEIPIPGVIAVETRCYLFTPAAGYKKPNVTVGCPSGNRCLPDNLNCPFHNHPTTDCPSPIGWCLPQAPADAYLDDIKTKLAAFPDSEKKMDVLAASKECNGHGKGSCHCDYGYTGPHCTNVINFCTLPEDHLELGNVVTTLGGVCGAHGTCQSVVAEGISCNCTHGWAGKLCDTPVPGEVSESARCYLFEPLSGHRNASVRIGCAASKHRCIADNLNCPFDNKPTDLCPAPIGWCLPEAQSAE